MRILAIRGENLASLAAPFAIDLSAGPIGATGIFAITGETGAGKSTILDALCLALYGQYPRVDVGRREKAPDPGGDPIGASDERAILRRGAGSGHAEVDFIGQDGIGYRARWEAFRARGRADGRLQAVRRLLTRLDDGAAIETGLTAVAAAIQLRTDLTFDQFRRTVLLAQGEFDAFLLAGEGERSDLLEKITGTEVYSAISKRVFEGAGDHRAGVRALEARRDAIGLLDETARAAILAERETITTEIATHQAEHVALRGALDRARAIAVTRGQIGAAEIRLAAARAQIETHRADAERLAGLDAVEPMRPAAEAVTTAERDLAEAESAVVTALASRAKAERGATEANAAHALAQAADDAAEIRFKAFGPVWDEAADLDTEIATAAQELAAAQEGLDKAKAESLAEARRLSDLDRLTTDAETASADTAARREADAGGAFLAIRGDETSALFAKRRDLAAETARARGARASAVTEMARCDTLIAEGARRIQAGKESRDAAKTRRAERVAALEAVGEAAARRRVGALDRLIALAQAAAPLAGGHADALVTGAEARAEAAEARAARDAAEKAGGQAALERAAIEAARREIAPLVELADESLSAEAAHLRSLLIVGEPCPVCGASEHHLADDRLSALAATLKARRAALDHDLARAAMAIDAASATKAAATGRLTEAERLAAKAERAIAEASLAYAAARLDLDATRAEAAIAAAAPEALDAAAPAAVALLLIAAKDAQTPLKAAIGAAEALRGEIDDLNRVIEAAGVEIEEADAACADEREARQRAALVVEGEGASLNGLTERVVSLDREIAPHLAAADLTPADLDRDAIGAARQAETRAAGHRALSLRADTLAGEAQALGKSRDGARITAAGAVGAFDKAFAEAEARAATLSACRAKRAPLLGGEATKAHRTRVNIARRQAAEARRGAEDARGEAAVALANAVTGATHSVAQRDRLLVQRAAARAALAAACGPIPEAEVAARLAVAPETRSRLRAGVDQRARDRQEAETELAGRRADLGGLLTAPEIDVVVTEAAAEALSETVAGRQQRLGAIASELARDDTARAQAAGLAAEIEAARADFAIWEAVDDAVGSADGGKFRRFAQGVTLEHLVRLANAQLQGLSPRYRLARGDAAALALHVIDRDMGDEARATRSLSGGERFLVSLALALALSGLEGRQSFVDTLFIDEGFGSLDAETLDLAVDALETLQGSGRKVGIITHVAAMIDRIAVQIRVEKRGNGRSVVRVTEAGGSTP